MSAERCGVRVEKDRAKGQSLGVHHRKGDRVVMLNQRQEQRKSEMLSKFRTI